MPPLSKLSFLLAFAAASISAHASTYVFLLAGQSNMSGRGSAAASTYASNASIRSYSDGTYGRPIGISTATNLLALDYGTMSGTQLGGGGSPKDSQVGPGGFFASALLPTLPAGSNILLVNVAWGGTTSGQWLSSAGASGPNGYQKSVNLYNNALNTYSAAWTAASTGGLNPVVGGILWLQGESDVDNSVPIATYTSNTESILGGFRSALSSTYGSTPKIVIGEISSTYANGANLRAAQQTIANDLGAGFASSSGLATQDAYTHFSAASQAIFGQRMETAYLTAVPEPTSCALMTMGALAVGFVRRRRNRA